MIEYLGLFPEEIKQNMEQMQLLCAKALNDHKEAYEQYQKDEDYS